jgi:LCP family protein required for cell wall assembly
MVPAMPAVGKTWRAMSAKSRIVAAGGLVIVLGATTLGAALAMSWTVAPAAVANEEDAGPTAVPPGTSLPPLPPTPSPDPSSSSTPAATPVPPGADPLLGKDGRFTILLLGSDYRPAHPGNRTDAIMVVSLDPVTGDSAAFSIPRDTTGFPLPGGGVFGGKVNALYQHLLATTSNGGAAMKDAVAKAFGIEIDWMAFIGFAGLKGLIDAVGGVNVTLAHAYYDAYYWVDSHHQGWGLPAGTSHLNGTQALIFARSRKGDNDFERARRQQQLVMAALAKVRTLGLSKLPTLLRIAASTVRTDLPRKEAVALFGLVTTADLEHALRTVFGPRKYATGTGGSSFVLNMPVCRAWIRAHFPEVRRNGTWPPTTKPVPTAIPSANP